MKDMQETKKPLIILIIAVILIGAVYYFSIKFKKEETKTFSDELSSSGKNVEIPENFPKDLPIVESNLIEAYTRDQDTKDITTVFESRKSAKENYDYYLNYAKTNGWQIDDAIELNNGSIFGISARKDNFFLNMSFEPKENNISIITTSSKLIKPTNANIDFKGLKLE